MTTRAPALAKPRHEGTYAARSTGSPELREGVGLESDVMSLQRKAGNHSVNALIGTIDGEQSQAQRIPANSMIDSLPVEEVLKSLPNLPPDQALLVLQRYQQFIIRRITTGEERIRDAQSLRAESFSNYLIGGTIELFGGTALPSDDWVNPWLHVNAAYSTMHKRQVKESLVNLNAAAEATNQRWKQLNEYFDQTEKGADRSIFALQAMQAAGAVAATALTGGGATAIAVGAGYGAAQNLAGQAAAVRIGIQSKIDWEGLAFDTLFGVLTGALGGKLGNTVLKKLMGNKAVASLGRRVVSEVVSDLVSGRLSSILQTTARSLFDHLRGKEDLTVEEFLHRLADQLMDPKAMLLDAVMGRASKLAHAPSSRASRKSDSKSSATGSESAAKKPGQLAAESTAATLPIEARPAKPLAPKPPTPPIPARERTVPFELTSSPVVQESTPSTGTKEAPISPSSGSPTGGGLELDLSGSRAGWNTHLEEFQVKETSKLSAEAKKPGFGEASTEKGGTEHHTGRSFHEYSAAEVAIGLRVDWDPQAGRPRKVSYQVTAETAAVPSQATDPSFHQEPRLRGESAQSSAKAYLKSGKEKGHLAQRVAGKVDAKTDAALGLKQPTGPEVERSLDVLTNVAPMTPTLNKGKPWRSAERRTLQFAVREGYVTVEITPIYEPTPPRLTDGTPIPSQFRRMIQSGPTGKVLEDHTFDNK